jgi:membrane associated rhomboid family serine protease
MQTTEDIKILKARLFVSFFTPALLVSIMLLTKVYESINGHELFYFGIEPRTLEGLRGIFLSPFIHADWDHLLSNAVPMLLLGTAAIYFYRNVAYKLLLLIWLFDGMGVWLFGRYSYHIGASGLIYGLASFLFISGLLRNNKGLLSLSFVVALLYGGLVWGILPQLVHLSWESHLIGLIAGMILAVIFMRQGPANDPLPEWYHEEETASDDTLNEEQSNEISGLTQDKKDSMPDNPEPKIIYHIKKNPPSEGT